MLQSLPHHPVIREGTRAVSRPDCAPRLADLRTSRRRTTETDAALINSGVDASHPAPAGAIVDGFNEPHPYGIGTAGGIVTVAQHNRKKMSFALEGWMRQETQEPEAGAPG